jgi:hypothetical protein
MKITSPTRRSIIAGTTRRVMYIAPSRFTSTSRRSSSGAASSIRADMFWPALFTSRSIAPSADSAAPQNASTDAKSVTSSACANAVPPSASICFATCSIRGTRRAPSATRQPWRASSSAVAAPIPDEAPVTIAVRGASTVAR